MASRLETILAALAAAIEAGTGLPVHRNEPLPLALEADGLVILRDGTAGEPEATLSPLTWHVEHVASVELFAGDDAAWDALKRALGAVLAADRELGGLCDWIVADPPDTETLAAEGGGAFKAGTVPVRLFYATPDPLA